MTTETLSCHMDNHTGYWSYNDKEWHWKALFCWKYIGTCLQIQRWQSRKWCRKEFCPKPMNFSGSSADYFGWPEKFRNIKLVIWCFDIEGLRPSPQGLGPQWEVGASLARQTPILSLFKLRVRALLWPITGCRVGLGVAWLWGNDNLLYWGRHHHCFI